MKQDTKRQLLKVDKEASAAREKAYQDYVMQYEMAVAKQQSEAWRKAIDGVPDSLRMLLEINNTENVPEYSEKQKSNITMQSRLMIDPGEKSIEPDGNGSRTASSSADRNGRKKCKSIRRSNAYLRTVKVSSTVCNKREENERIKK